jgi:hypothetical protein
MLLVAKAMPARHATSVHNNTWPGTYGTYDG